MLSQQQYHRPQFAPDWAKTPSPPSTMITTAENGELVICSIDLAVGLGVQHKNLLETIQKYLSSIEKFGRVAFETRPFATRGGNQQVRIALLNENQSLLIGSLSKNTVQVVAFKVTLVEEFDKAKKAIAALFKKPEPIQSEQITGLVKVVNDLQVEVIALRKEADRNHKSYTKYFEAKVVESQKPNRVCNLDPKTLEKRDRAMRGITSLINTSVFRTLSWSKWWAIFQEDYHVDLSKLKREEGECFLDIAARHGYIDCVLERIAYTVS